MPLPKISAPIYTTILPSSGKKISYRPFLVKEEKLLMIAGKSEDAETIITNTNQVLQNCVQDKDFNAETVASYDAQWLFLKLREASIGDTVHAKVRCPISGEFFDAELDLKLATVVKTEGRTGVIIFEQEIGMTLRDVSLKDIYLELTKLAEDEYAGILNLVKKCIINIFDADNVYDAKDLKDADIVEFLDGLKKQHMDKLTDYFNNAPKIRLEQDVYSPHAKKDVKLVLENFMDFFA